MTIKICGFFLLFDRVLPSVAVWAVLALPIVLVATEGCFYFSRETVGQNRVRKKTAFLRASLARTAKKSARQSAILCAISSNIVSNKKKKFWSFCLEIFPRPPCVFLGFVLLSVVISVEKLKNNSKQNDFLLGNLSASRARRASCDVFACNS